MIDDENVVQACWEKARIMSDRNPEEWRQDQCGAWLHRTAYDREDSEFGWKILNVTPEAPEAMEDLQPFHWKNSYDIATGRAHCRVSADRAGLAPGQRVGEPRNAGVD